MVYPSFLNGHGLCGTNINPGIVHFLTHSIIGSANKRYSWVKRNYFCFVITLINHLSKLPKGTIVFCWYLFSDGKCLYYFLKADPERYAIEAVGICLKVINSSVAPTNGTETIKFLP